MSTKSEEKVAEIVAYAINSLAELQAIPRAKPERFFVEHWQKEVYLRIPKAADRGRFEQLVAGVKDRPRVDVMKMRLVAMSLCDKDGNLLVPDQDRVQKYLGDVDSVAIEEISQRVLEISRISEEDIDAAEKN